MYPIPEELQDLISEIITYDTEDEKAIEEYVYLELPLEESEDKQDTDWKIEIQL